MQLNLFDNMDEILKWGGGELPLVSSKATPHKSYLNPKKKIDSLKKTVKEILNDKRKEARISDIFDVTFNIKENWNYRKKLNYIFKRIGKKYIAPILNSFESFEDFVKIQDLLREDDREITIEPIREKSEKQELVFRCMKEGSTGSYTPEKALELLPVKISYKDKTGALRAIGCLKGNIRSEGFHKSLRAFKGSKEGYHMIVDIPTLLGELLFSKSIRDYIKSDTNNKKIRYRFFNSLMYEVPKDSKSPFTDGKLKKLYLPKETFDNEKVKEELKEYGLHEYVHYVSEEKRDVLLNDFFPYLKVWHKDNIFRYSFLKNPEEAMMLGSIYHDVKNSDDKEYVNIKYFTNSYDYVPLLEIFTIMHSENIQLKNEAEKEKKMATNYARAFETKKNIPLKVKKAMKTSKFNKFFGYVEFDELVDLEKIEQIEKEFLAFADMFNIEEYKDHSLRFRRLGKHRAAGLYYPYQKALCVDIGSPSSMIHEYLHMVDFSNGRLSKKPKFFPIVDKYTKVLDETVSSLPKDEPFRNQWYGRTKYNRDYYLDPAEIFARCGEIYIKYILGVDNSLIDATEDYIYPKNNQELLTLIKIYFDSVLSINKAKIA